MSACTVTAKATPHIIAVNRLRAFILLPLLRCCGCLANAVQGFLNLGYVVDYVFNEFGLRYVVLSKVNISFVLSQAANASGEIYSVTHFVTSSCQRRSVEP